MRKKFYEEFDNEYYLHVARYANNNRLYIGLYNQIDELVDDITINLSDIKIKSDNQIFLSGNLSNNVQSKLLDKEIISKPKFTQKYNMGVYQVVDVNLDILKEYDSEGVQEFLNHQEKKEKKDNNLFRQYSVGEIKKILDNNTKLVYIDSGIDECVIRYKDLPDVIVDLNNKYGTIDLKVYDYQNPSSQPILTTFGPFLNKCDSTVRNDIIDRLLSLQTGEQKIRNYKIINEEILENIKNTIEYEEMER